MESDWKEIKLGDGRISYFNKKVINLKYNSNIDWHNTI
jgi:hypothetical protein